MNEVSENAVLEALQISDGKSQAVFVFALLVLMKKSIIVALGMAAFVVPFLSYSYYYLHIPIHPYLFLP